MPNPCVFSGMFAYDFTTFNCVYLLNVPGEIITKHLSKTFIFLKNLLFHLKVTTGRVHLKFIRLQRISTTGVICRLHSERNGFRYVGNPIGAPNLYRY